jgi:anti-anti-sigma factor
MTLEMTSIHNISIVMIPQQFDANTAPGLESDLRAILTGSPQKMILDFSKTEYIASAGLKVLLLITRDLMKTGGQVALTGLRPAVLRVFAIAGFTSIFTICTSQEEAIQKMT